MENDTYEILVKLAVILFGILGAIYQVRNFSITLRSSIKTDLEILRMLDPNDPNHILVQNKINESIKKVYRLNQKQLKIYKPADLLFGLLFFFGFGIWTIYLSWENFSVWSLLTINFVITGIGGILSAFQPKKEKKI